MPTERVLEVAIALLQQSEALSEFDAYRQDGSTRDIIDREMKRLSKPLNNIEWFS